MNEPFIARERECAELQRCLDSGRSELVIVYGRRRVGKTFLIAVSYTHLTLPTT